MTKNNNQPPKVVIRRLEGFKPPINALAKFRREGRFLTMRYSQKKIKTHVRRHNKTQYINLRTGELCDYSVTTEEDKNRVRRIALKRTFSDLRAVLRANFSEGEENSLFVTLTYAHCMTDQKQLFKDFEKFMKRLKYQFPEHNFEYVTVAEPQGSGSWHFHMLLKSTNNPVLIIPDRQMRSIWKHGITKTERLKSNDIGMYYTAYFTGLLTDTYSSTPSDASDCALSDETLTSEEIFNCEQRIVTEGNKMRVKGARLCFYPKGFHFYRCSRGIIRPKEYESRIGDNIGGCKLVFSEAYEVDITQKAEINSNASNSSVDEFNSFGDTNSPNRIYNAVYRTLDPLERI